MLFGALAIFLLYALNFFYFFVDDEGIPLVYAQNLIRGRGLTYSAIEGHIEGYSDFLHVLFDALLLLIVKAMHWPKITVFRVGDAIGLLAGLGTVTLAFLTMRRAPAVRAPGAVAGLALLALSGPLAVWSCSSLETVPFTFFVALMLFGLVAGGQAPDSRRLDRVVLGAGVAAVLERLDGPIYVAALIAAFAIASSATRRADMMKRIVWPLVAACVVYHGWRIWYFRDLLNMPLYAKVMYKLKWSANAVTKSPLRPYWVRFSEVYGWPAVAIAGAAAAYAARHEQTARPVLLAFVCLAAYVSYVGDWMFGFRFFVHLMPVAALMMAFAVSVAFGNRRGAAWTAAIAVVVWCGVAATAFERQYEAAEEKQSWWRERSLDERRLFGTYYSTYEAVRDGIGAGTTVAFSQAGFVPFMLELENVDTLGICSRFYAEMPTRDIFFTEVGRYSPFTASRSINAEQAYLLYHDVPFIIERRDLLWKAHAGRVPDAIMGGYYAAIPSGATGDVIYRRTDRDASEYKTNPRLFFENVAHVSYLRSAAVNGQAVPRSSIVRSLPFLREDTGNVVMVHGRYTLDLQFGAPDVEVSELDLNLAVADAPVVITLDLRSADGFARHIARFDLAKATPREFMERLPVPVMASRLSVQIDGPVDSNMSIWLTDLRVQGQTAELARYIRERLRFEPSQMPSKSGGFHRVRRGNVVAGHFKRHGNRNFR
jgi:hypothetical protein